MRILYFCTFYHRALLFRQQIDALNDRGHKVQAFNSAKYGEGIADKFKSIMDDIVIHTECWNKLDRAMFFPRQWKIENKLQKSYNLKKFDLLHSHLLLSSGYSAMRMKKKYGIPYVISIRVTDLTGFIKIPYFKKLAAKIIKEASGVIFLSVAHKQQLFDLLRNSIDVKTIEEKCAIIGNCIENFWCDNSKTVPKRFERGKNIHILSVAKILPVKNLPVAAQSVEILKRRGYNADLTIIGEVQDQKEYERLKKYSCVKICPFMSKEELIDAYGASDIFLLPSVNETFGRVYIEAMTQGLPVLYTENQGFDKNFPDGEVGYSIPSDEPERIADKVECILSNYEEISKNCLKDCRLFYEETIIDRLEQFYQRALNRGR